MATIRVFTYLYRPTTSEYVDAEVLLDPDTLEMREVVTPTLLANRLASEDRGEMGRFLPVTDAERAALARWASRVWSNRADHRPGIDRVDGEIHVSIEEGCQADIDQDDDLDTDSSDALACLLSGATVDQPLVDYLFAGGYVDADGSLTEAGLRRANADREAAAS